MSFLSLRGACSPSAFRPQPRPSTSCRSSNQPQGSTSSSFNQTTGASSGGPSFAPSGSAAIPGYTPVVAGLLGVSLGMVAYGNMESQRQVSEGMARAAAAGHVPAKKM